jgi:hypothetical protein
MATALTSPVIEAGPNVVLRASRRTPDKLWLQAFLQWWPFDDQKVQRWL